MVLELRTQLQHTMHLFFVIAASVIARNVANQEVLVASGPQILGKLYIATALVAGVVIAALGWVGREQSTRRVVQTVHIGAVVLMVAAFLSPERVAEFAVVKYVAMEVAFAALLLSFGIMMGASLGPREARQVAARIGAGGIIGGLVAGGVLSAGAILIGSRALYLVAAAFALVPIFFLPRVTARPLRRRTVHIQLEREGSDVPALNPYGRWVAVTTLIMVAATTMVDYQFRSFAGTHYNADGLTSFFGNVFSLAGVTTLLFQFTILKQLLKRLGIFGTATVMPSALILALGAFGMVPGVIALVVLKLVDSGANMSLQQATGGLLLAPLSPSARSVWQGRIDGMAKRGGQALTGLFLVFFPWTPTRVLPMALILCALWIGSILITRLRYVQLLTQMLGAPATAKPALEAFDGATLRLLENELADAQPERAAVILDLLENVGHRAPAHLLQRLAEADPSGPGALRVVEHLAKLELTGELFAFAKSPHRQIAAAALLALIELDSREALAQCHDLIQADETPEPLRALAAGLLSDSSAEALNLCDDLSRSRDRETRMALVRSFGHADFGGPPEIGAILTTLAVDVDAEIARLALETLGRHPTEQIAETAIHALRRRETRGAATRALAEMGQPVVARLAIELEERRDNPVLAEALTRALGRIGSAEGVDPLVQTLAAKIVQVRLSAATALSSMARRQVHFQVAHEQIAQHYMPEIEFYTRMRTTSLSHTPDTPAGHLLSRTLKQRGQASLETLFRMLELHYPVDAMQGALQAINSGDARRRQVALELLDTILDSRICEAISRAIGSSASRSRAPLNGADAVMALGRDPDPFLSSLARAVVVGSVNHSPEVRREVKKRGKTMALTVVDQILELQSISLFSQSTAEDLAEVASLVSARRVPKGTVLFREEEPADAMYVVRSGDIALSRRGKIADHVGAGEACGIVAVLDQLPREVTATTTIDSSVLVLHADAFMQLLADRPLLMYSVFRALTGVLRQQLDRFTLGKKSEQDWSW